MEKSHFWWKQSFVRKENKLKHSGTTTGAAHLQTTRRAFEGVLPSNLVEFCFSMYQSATESISQLLSYLVSQLLSQSVSYPLSQCVSSPLSQSVSSPLSQSASQPVSQVAPLLSSTARVAGTHNTNSYFLKLS